MREFLRLRAPIAKKPRKKPLTACKRANTVNPGFKMLVIALKFGSITDTSRILKGDCAISKELGCRQSTVATIVRMFL